DWRRKTHRVVAQTDKTSGQSTVGARMPRSFLSAFSSLIRAGTKSGPQRVIGWTTVRRLVLYYTAMVALVSLVDFSLPLPPSEKGRMLAPWLERMMLGTATGMRIVP